MKAKIPKKKNYKIKTKPPASSARGAILFQVKDLIRRIKFGFSEIYKLAAGIKPPQTFFLILPNLIHQSKKKNLKR